MTVDDATDLVRETLLLTLIVSGPVLAAALIVGLAISLLQAVTQIQEQTLSFVPKIVAMAVVAIVAMPWVLTMVMEFAARMFGGSP